LIITLPFPPSILRPNDKSHWRVKNPTKAKYRQECALLSSHIKYNEKGPVRIHISFYPPNNRWDWDGMVSAAKAGFDGFADGIGVNDKRFDPTLSFKKADKENPRIEIILFESYPEYKREYFEPFEVDYEF